MVPHVAHFLAEPLADLPPRRPGSLRRTSSVDMVGTVGGDLELIGRGRDPNGRTASCHAIVAPDRSLASLEVSPDLPASQSLLGLMVGRGFRAAVDELCTPGTLPSVLLCELPVAALLSGYGALYSDHFPSPISDTFLAGLPVDVCAGWAEPASVMLRIRAERIIPTPDGPLTPDWSDSHPGEEVIDDRSGSGDESGAGEGAWHDMPALEPGSMRRQRLIQRDGDEVWAMFRDSYARPDGPVTVLHEYSLAARLSTEEVEGDGSGPGSRSRSRVLSCVATPRVLPWAECPLAAASAARVEGQLVGDLRRLVKEEMLGTSTCTHLNDLLASLSQVDALIG
jgi:hypothetical protein